MLASNNR